MKRLLRPVVRAGRVPAVTHPNRMLVFVAMGIAMLLATSGCSLPIEEDHPATGPRFPIGIVADPAGDYLYVTNSNFDRRYLGANLIAVDVASGRVVDTTNVQIQSFPGDMDLLVDSTGAATTIFIASRDGSVITEIELSRRTDGTPEFRCAMVAPSDGDVPLCAGIGPNVEEPETAGAQPFGLTVRPYDTAGIGHIYVSSFDGTFSVYRLEAGKDTRLAGQTALGGGAYGVAVHPTTGEVYVTTKDSDRFFTVTVDDTGTEVAFSPRAIDIPNTTSGFDFGRGIAFNESGTQAYIAYRTPASLLVLDTSVGTDGRARNIIVDNVPLPTGPAAVTVARTSPAGEELVYVTLFDSDELAVIDPRRLEVVALVTTGDGPFDVTAVEQAGVKKAYVTLFEEDTVSVIDIDPTSVFYHQEIARIP